MTTTPNPHLPPQEFLGVAVFAARGGLPSLYHPAEPLTEAALCDWIANAQVGESIQYHEGFLLIDRSESASALPRKDRLRLHAMARRAWIACELGLVHLFSLRVGECRYRYMAIRSGSVLSPTDIQARLKPLKPVSPRVSH